jgi:hypothetical protein
MSDEELAAVIERVRGEGRAPRVLVTGSREWADLGPIRRELAKLPAGAIVIHGAARGADRLAGEAAAGLGLDVRPCPADWERYGKGAGHIRNRRMLAEDKPDLVLAFHGNLDESSGTRHMVEIGSRAAVPVKVIRG